MEELINTKFNIIDEFYEVSGIKDKIEKKANLKIQKLGSRWTKRLLPQVRKDMKDAFRTRMKSSSTKDLRDED